MDERPVTSVLVLSIALLGFAVSCRNGKGSADIAADASAALVVPVPRNRQELVDEMRRVRARHSAAQRAALQEVVLEGQDAAAAVDAPTSPRRR